MSQVINGIMLGAPGVVNTGPRGIFILHSAVDPDSSTDPNCAGAQLGSLLVNYVTPSLWFKTDLTQSPTHPNGIWTQLTIP